MVILHTFAHPILPSIAEGLGLSLKNMYYVVFCAFSMHSLNNTLVNPI